MIGTFEIVCGVVLLGVVIYRFMVSKFNYWKDRGIDGPVPIALFGNSFEISTGKISMGHYLKRLYDQKKKDPAIGIFMGRQPVLVVQDPEMIKAVLIKDFSNFADRGMMINEKLDPLSIHLFSLEPERWRPLRMKLSPTFTTGKLKEMCAMITECSEHLEVYLAKLVEKNPVQEVRELTARFTTDVIGTCAFGIDTRSMAEEESEFRKMGKVIFDPNTNRAIRFKIQQFLPWLGQIVGHILSQDNTPKFFLDLTLGTIDYRRKHNIFRNDFINTLMELKDHPESLGNIKLTDNLLVSQAMIFFAAGFETSSTTISHALYELALNQEVQNKLRENIEEDLKRHKGDLRYENIKEMCYLDKVFKETLRKYPPVTVLMRKSLSSYKFEGTKIKIEEKQPIWIPALALHHDPEIYPKPEVFDPERFTEEAEKSRHPMTYLPFGDGPRNCIGARFAVYQTKIGLIKIIKNYKVERCEKTMVPYNPDPKAFVLSPKGGIHLKFTKINQS